MRISLAPFGAKFAALLPALLLLGTSITIVPTTRASEDSTYIFYLHGRIIEEEGETPTHPQWGLYDYPSIVKTLESDGAVVKSEVRSSGTNIYEYAGKTIREIEQLIAEGVSPRQIVVVGFSKGGSIAIHVSSYLRRPEIRYVFLAACSDWLTVSPQLRMTGYVLSIFEESDTLAGSCRDFSSRENSEVQFVEKRIETGKQHGAFYMPHSEWIDPVLRWLHGESI